MRRLIIFVLSLCMTFGMIACSSDANMEETTTSNETSQTVVETNNGDFDEILNAIEGILSYPNLSITHDGTSVTVQYWYSGLAQAVDMAIDGDEDKEKLWTSYVENETTQCKTLYDMLVQAGFSDCSVTWNVLNDLDTENTLLVIINGEVKENVAD